MTSRITLLAVLLAVGLTGCAEAERMARDATATGTAVGRTVTASEIDWNHRSVSNTTPGVRLAYDCPPNPSRSMQGSTKIWGSNPYTSDSGICLSAVHAGAISFAQGGRVMLEVQGRQERYPATTRNGVTSVEYGPWSTSYVVLR